MSVQTDALNELINKFVGLRDQRLALDRASKQLKATEQELEQELWLLMESLKMTSVKIEGIGLVQRTYRNNPYVTEFKEFRDWCIEFGFDDLIREEAARQKLRDFVSARIKDGITDAIPPGVEWQTDRIISIKGREKGDGNE